MTFGMTLAEHLTMAASASLFYIAINYENELNMKLAASNANIKIHQLFSKQLILGVARPLHNGKPQEAWHEQTVFRFPFSYENEKLMKVLKIQRKNLLNMKMVVSYLNFVFLIDVEAKSK